MIAPEEIERSLREALPAQLQPRAGELARLIVAAAAGESPDADAFKPALEALAGREVHTAHGLIRFGDGNQIGDVQIGDVAGGDIVRVSLTINQPAPRTLPRYLVVAALIVPLLAAAAAFVVLHGPSTMPNTFSVAVANLALDAGGDPQGVAAGRALSEQIFLTLKNEEQAYSAQWAESITVWHDSMPWWEKSAPIGFVGGATQQEREDTARALLERLNADVLIYGYIDAAERVSLHFFVAPDLKTEGPPTTIAGDFTLGNPIAPSDPEFTLATRAGALFWLLKSLQYDSLGRSEQALAVLQFGAERLLNWSERGEGKELLYFFTAQAAAFAATDATTTDDFDARLNLAQQQAQLALDRRPDFVRALVVRGAVAHQRAQCLLGAPPCPPPDETTRTAAAAAADQALADYEAAVVAAATSHDTFWATSVAPMAVGSAWLLRGEVSLQQSDRAGADTAYAEAVEWVRSGLAAAESAGDQRVLGQAQLVIGTALWRRAWLASADQPGRAAELLNEARAAFAACNTIADASNDQLLRDRIGADCRSFDSQAAILLEEVAP